MKFRKEKYITQIPHKDGTWSFRVRYKGQSKFFNETDYLSSSQAFKSAVAYRNRILVEPIFTSGKTVRECYEELEDIYVIRSETKRKLDGFFNKYISKKDTALDKITRADILADLNAMVNTCSNDTITRVLSIWRKIYGVAVAKNYIARDLSLNIIPPKSHHIRTKKRIELTDEQSLDLLINSLKNRLKSPLEKEYAECIIYILLYTGMRPSELFALDKTDIDLKARTISISKEMGSDRDKQDVIRPCKTELSHRVIPISSKCLPYIKKAMSLTNSSILFPNRDIHYSTKDLGDRFHFYGKMVGVDFHFYQLRHTFITRLFMQGIDLKTIQELVGQKVDATTIGYVVSDQKRRQNAVELV